MARLQLAAIVAAFMAVLLGLERLRPLRRPGRALFGRLLLNGALSFAALGTALLVVRPAALASLGWASGAPLGIAGLLPASGAARAVASFLLLDLTFYWWHVANHRLPLLWRFHNVHHIDPDLDVSTAFRFHAGEVAISAIFRVLQIATIGPPVAVFAAYELAFQANTVFHHSNVRLPIRLERLLNVLLVTPRMHGIHHSQVRAETNSNYSVVFSWWDRLHRTIGLGVPQAEIVIGVPAYSNPSDNTLRSALLLPFRPQRDYWRAPDGSEAQRHRVGRAGRLME